MVLNTARSALLWRRLWDRSNPFAAAFAQLFEVERNAARHRHNSIELAGIDRDAIARRCGDCKLATVSEVNTFTSHTVTWSG